MSCTSRAEGPSGLRRRCRASRVPVHDADRAGGGSPMVSANGSAHRVSSQALRSSAARVRASHHRGSRAQTTSASLS